MSRSTVNALDPQINTEAFIWTSAQVGVPVRERLAQLSSQIRDSLHERVGRAIQDQTLEEARDE